MKKLNELFKCDYDISIKSIQEDSRVKDNDYLFCCIEGLTVDGHKYANKAVENGAVAVIASKDVDVNVPVIKVDDTNKAMSQALSKFYNEVDKKLKLIGVTGTDGKTTLSSIVYQLINEMDHCGYIGTNGLECKKYVREQKFTCPFPRELYAYLDDFYQAGCKYVSLEATSERLGANRLSELEFDVAIFTNLTRDHLNTHKTMDNYFEAKAKLFSLVKDNGYLIINNDDIYGQKLVKITRGNIITYGIDNVSDVMAKDIVIKEDKITFTLLAPYGKYYIECPLSGKFNVYNLMAAITACYNLGFDINAIIDSVKKLKPIRARQAYVNCGQPFKVMIDYAHTANALKNLLEYINVIKKGRIIVVIGSGGLRDVGRRIEIGEVVTKLADHVIFTLEDPRTEDVNNIIDDMLTNVKGKFSNYERVIDRIEAIHKAIDIAEQDDIILIAGKGDENYQDINGQYVPYPTDFEVAEEHLKKEVLVCH